MTNFKVITNRSKALGLLCLAALSLSGCISDDIAMDDTMASKPYAGSKAFPISVEKGPISLEVSSAHGTLQPPQINAVTAFVNQAMAAGVTPVTINRPSGGGASARVASEIASVMAQQGLARNMLRVATYSGPASGAVVVSYVSTYAKTKKCGDWPDDASETDLNEHLSSHGCAVQANIAAMIANPETLVVPSATTPIVAATRSVGINSLSTRQTSNIAGQPITTLAP
jgi:pilus assembly protein CpaD